MSGPPVQQVTQIDSFEMLKSQNDLFFVYVGEHNGSLWDMYFAIAEHFQPHAYFYATNRELATQHFQIDTLPVVLVYKESHYYHFPCKLFHPDCLSNQMKFGKCFDFMFIFAENSRIFICFHSVK